MRPVQSLGRAIVYLWQGPPSLPRSLQLEWRFVVVRWLGIVIVAPGLLLTNLAPGRLLVAYAVLALAGIYNLTVQLMMRRRPEVIANGYLTVIGDALLNIAMINVGGGFNSPFYYLLFTVTISAAMRYGYRPSLVTVLTYIVLDAVESRLGFYPLDGTFLFRSGFLFITVVLAGYLREQAQRAEMALQERLRQANLLNEATATLGASLEFETVLHTVAAAAGHLFGGRCVVLQPATELDGAVDDAITYVGPDAAPATAAARQLEGQLTTLCGQYADAERWPLGGHQPFHWTSLPSGRRAIVLRLALPTRQTSLATLAADLAPAQLTPSLDPDILGSFVERTALAIENASLYRTLASRTTDLQRAYSDLAIAHQELLGVDEMKTNFLANVSHELRTPLSSIRSFSELLLSYRDDLSVQEEFLQIINLESERLTRLVNDVLDISKIEAGELDWEMTAVDVAALLHDSARTYAALIAETGLAFRQEIDDDLPQVYADRDRLQQVIGNLLSNAVKFTPRGGIRLSAARVGGEVYVAVTDTGVGIAPEDQERIFEKFQQVGDTLTDKPRGTGLGLCICREIVLHHNGRLWVESQLGAGSTFTVALPVGVAATAGVEQRDAAPVA